MKKKKQAKLDRVPKTTPKPIINQKRVHESAMKTLQIMKNKECLFSPDGKHKFPVDVYGGHCEYCNTSVVANNNSVKLKQPKQPKKIKTSSNHQDIRDSWVELTGDDDLLFADGFDEAIIGVSFTDNRVCYDVEKMVEILSRDMPESDAWEYLDFNTFNAYVGDRTPIYVRTKI